MEQRIITKEVKISSMNKDWEDVREYGVSLNTIKREGKSRVFINVEGVDEECDGMVGIPVEDIPLLQQAIKEFC